MSTKKPAAIRILEGNPGKRLIEESGVEALGAPFVPEHLMDDARGCIEVIRASMPSSVYSALDSFHLAAFGMAWAIRKRAALEIGNPAFVWIVEGSTGAQTPSPWIKILNAQAAIIASLGDRLGLARRRNWPVWHRLLTDIKKSRCGPRSSDPLSWSRRRRRGLFISRQQRGYSGRWRRLQNARRFGVSRP
jgi:hypothetical protein